MMSGACFELDGLNVISGSVKTVTDLNLRIPHGHLFNLQCKSAFVLESLALALTNHPGHKIAGGKIIVDGNNISAGHCNCAVSNELFLIFNRPKIPACLRLREYLKQLFFRYSREDKGINDFNAFLLQMGKDLSFDLKHAGSLCSGELNDECLRKIQYIEVAVMNPKIVIMQGLGEWEFSTVETLKSEKKTILLLTDIMPENFQRRLKADHLQILRETQSK
ncbi:MAG: hypothetical protein HQK54_09095 [Oligoflexales bacterium]|nr:hypothetical protein [Oligoflexales bacterium]